MNSYVLYKDSIPILIEIIDKEPGSLSDEEIERLIIFTKKLLSTEENFKNNKFAWNQFYYGEYVSPVEKEINIYRLDFADKELYSIHFNATDEQNLYNYNHEVSALQSLILDTLLYGILFIEKEKYRYFKGSVINFNLDINEKNKFSEIKNHFEYSEFIDYLSKKLNYDFTFLK